MLGLPHRNSTYMFNVNIQSGGSSVCAMQCIPTLCRQGVPQPHPPGGRIDGNWFSTISQMSTQCDDDDGENSNDDDGDGDNDKTKLSTTPV